MKTKILKFILPISLILILSSCVTPRMFTTLDVLRPAEVTFNPEVQNVLIVNNSVVQPYNVGHADIKSSATRNNPVNVSLKFDSAALFCAASLRENLEAKDFFYSVSMSQTNMNTTDNYYRLAPLNKQTVRFLCGLYNADALISLDHIQTEDKSYMNSGNIQSALDVKINTKWTIHYPTDSLSVFKEFSDEFSWDDAQFNKLPNRYDALVDACILTGSNIADRMIPRWEKEDRYFYTPKKQLFVQAMDSLTYKKWQAAIDLWVKASETTKNNKTKFHAYNNIAIAYEIMGNLDKAMNYASKAVETFPNIIAFSSTTLDEIYELLDYYEILKKRKQEAILLDKQLND